MNAIRLGKTFEPVGQGEALTKAVRRISEKGEIKLSAPLLGIFTKISRQNVSWWADTKSEMIAKERQIKIYVDDS